MKAAWKKYPLTGSNAGLLMQCLGAAAAANCGLLMGLSLGWSSAVMVSMAMPLSEWSWVVSLYPLGAAGGSAVVGLMLRSLGRRAVILLIAPLSAAGWALLFWTTQVWMLYAGRVLAGVASGASCVAVPVFISEMAQPHIRGALTTFFEITVILGILVVYLMGKWMSVFWINVVCLSFAVLHGACYVWFPDTPRWFLLHNRRPDARKALIFYRGSEHDVDAELDSIESGVKVSLEARSGLAAFRTEAAWKGLTLSAVLIAFQQITGINAITFYATKLFTEAGLRDPNVASVTVTSTEVVAACVSMLLVDKLGRRALLLASAASMGACTAILGTYFFLKTETAIDVSHISWLPVVVVAVYRFMFSIGYGPVVWVFVGEIFPDNIKSAAAASVSVICWLSAFLVSNFYPAVSERLGEHVSYWIFSALCVLSCLFIGICLPETKGRTLDEIQADLSVKRQKNVKVENDRL